MSYTRSKESDRPAQPGAWRTCLGACLWRASWVLLVLVFWCGRVQGQNIYLEPMGGSEVELFFYLDQAKGAGMQRRGEEVAFKGQDLNARYKINRGLVTEVHFDQLFYSRATANATFDQSLQFLRERGIMMKVIPTSQHARIMRGEGAGMRSSLVLVPCPTGYRIEASIAEVK